MKIKFLTETTINRIAAGEVIERPASVVKELVENSIDAGATQIEIFLERAGKNLITVVDNGCGMSLEDLEIAILRHTTSKLDENDLLNINTFGFRGEALPSIAAISKLSITSKKQDTKGYNLTIIGGAHKIIKPAIHNTGTKIEVRDLFFATPARLKFLRTDKTEFSVTHDVIKKLSLAHPNIDFLLYHDGKTIINARFSNKKETDELRYRVSNILGQEFIENSLPVELEHQEAKIIGFISLPTFNRASAEDQFLFINNRPVKDKMMNMALRIAYQDYLARDRHPLAVLYLYINPQLVDVNVHPAKSEVRFHDPNYIRSLMIEAIRLALSNIKHKVSTSYTKDAIGLFKTEIVYKNSDDNVINSSLVSDVVSNYRINNNMGLQKQSSVDYKNPKTEPNEIFYPANKASPNSELVAVAKPFIQTMPNAKKADSEIVDLDLDINEFPLGVAKAQIYSTYIISQAADSMIIVDQHAAHERLGYEKIKQTLAQSEIIKQRLLIPEIIELPDKKRADLLCEYKDTLFDLGLTIEKFGESTIIVSEVLSLLGDINIKQLINDIADNLLEIGEDIALTKLIEHIIETYACHYAIRAGRKLSFSEMNELLRQMEKVSFSGQCNHGRPTYIKLQIKDIEKLFGRR